MCTACCCNRANFAPMSGPNEGVFLLPAPQGKSFQDSIPRCATNYPSVSLPASSSPPWGASQSPDCLQDGQSYCSLCCLPRMPRHREGRPQHQLHHPMPPHLFPRASNRHVGSTGLLGQYQTHHHSQVNRLDPRRKVYWLHKIIHPNCLAFLARGLVCRWWVACEVYPEISWAVGIGLYVVLALMFLCYSCIP